MGAPPIHLSMACRLAHSLLHTHLAHSPSHPCSLMGLSHHPWVWWDRASNGSCSCPHGHRLWPSHSLLHTHSCTLTLPLLFPIGFEPPPVGCTVREWLMGAAPIHCWSPYTLALRMLTLAHSCCTLTSPRTPIGTTQTCKRFAFSHVPPPPQPPLPHIPF